MAGLVGVPNVDIEFIEAKGGETFKLGPITCRVLEDGSHTGKRSQKYDFGQDCFH